MTCAASWRRIASSTACRPRWATMACSTASGWEQQIYPRIRDFIHALTVAAACRATPAAAEVGRPEIRRFLDAGRHIASFEEGSRSNGMRGRGRVSGWPRGTAWSKEFEPARCRLIQLAAFRAAACAAGPGRIA